MSRIALNTSSPPIRSAQRNAPANVHYRFSGNPVGEAVEKFITHPKVVEMLKDAGKWVLNGLVDLVTKKYPGVGKALKELIENVIK